MKKTLWLSLVAMGSLLTLSACDKKEEKKEEPQEETAVSTESESTESLAVLPPETEAEESSTEPASEIPTEEEAKA